MIYDLRFTICRRRREEALIDRAGARALARFNFRSSETQEILCPHFARKVKRRERRAPRSRPQIHSSVRSEIFIEHAPSMTLKPRRGDIILEIARRGVKQAFRDVTPTELCSIGGDGNYKYAAPDGAICGRGGQCWRTV